MTSTRNITFGANSDYYADYQNAVSGAHGVRYYTRQPDPSGATNPITGFIPASYASLNIPSGAKALITLYLFNKELLAGTFDSALLTFFASCPANTYISLWQEVGTITWTANDQGCGVGPNTIVGMNNHMQNLINANRRGRGANNCNNVKFGPITCGIGQIAA